MYVNESMRWISMFFCIAAMKGHSTMGTQSRILAPLDEQVIDSYDKLFNDIEAVEKGKFGISRVRNNPMDSHTSLRNVRRPSEELDHYQLAIIGLRSKLREKFYVEEGMITVATRISHPVAFWFSFGNGERLFGNQSRERTELPKELDKLARDSKAAILKRPDKVFITSIRGWTIKSKAVLFRKNECLKCHKGSKLNDPAAIMAVATKPR